MQSVGKVKNKNLTCIPSNSEKYISFSLGPLRFLDSLQFLNASLEKLVLNLEKNELTLTNKFFKEKTDLMLHKGIYPYKYMDTFQKFNEGCLPSKEAFFSSLTNEAVSDDDYAHCQNVWKSFNLKTLGEYYTAPGLAWQACLYMSRVKLELFTDSPLT
ncbi:c2H2-type domain-containing protein [Trichonephila inaurata madagascariensis]|uniref:C2H2-type domain-containing protein n=1 Tax=Trichonephila inaurata madagascariensis TaxID=2747483 RepID=A0A8X6X9V0_9ARAC|nr:c2H2-type domain-containing protein [Trichonephila inaurata madagascariensis]